MREVGVVPGVGDEPESSAPGLFREWYEPGRGEKDE